jgi:hypothetical protein
MITSLEVARNIGDEKMTFGGQGLRTDEVGEGKSGYKTPKISR